jgi:acetyl-CoA C-acetyltransferase
MHMTKHAYELWSTEPGAVAVADPDQLAREVAQDLERAPITDVYEGPATVATYSVLHGRDGLPTSGVLVVDLPDGSRAYARCEDADALARAEDDELVGQPVSLTPNDQSVNEARF